MGPVSFKLHSQAPQQPWTSHVSLTQPGLNVAAEETKLWLALPSDGCGCNAMVDWPIRSLRGGLASWVPHGYPWEVVTSLALSSSSFPLGQSYFSFRKGKASRAGSSTPSETSIQPCSQLQRSQGQITGSAWEWVSWADKAVNLRKWSLVTYIQKGHH